MDDVEEEMLREEGAKKECERDVLELCHAVQGVLMAMCQGVEHGNGRRLMKGKVGGGHVMT